MKKIFIIFIFLLLAGLTSCTIKQPSLMDKVDDEIDVFITDFAGDYFQEEDGVLTIEYHVSCALAALSEIGYDVDLNDFLDKDTVQSYYDNYEYSSPVDAFKAIMNCLAFNVSYSKAEDYLETLEEVDPYSINYALLSLNVTGSNSTLKAELLSIVNVIREEDYRDADYAGAALMATSSLDIDKTSLFALINDNVTKDGVSAWGNINACSTAYSILGLIASGIDPTSEEYTIEGTNLVEALLGFEQDGVFKFTLDGNQDLGFSTPQAFSALVAYKIFEESNQPFVLFSDHNQ